MEPQEIATQLLGSWRIISSLIVLAGTAYAIYLCVSGFLPVLVRLGNGLRRRKIAIFAKGTAADSLHALFADTKLFKEKNIIRIVDRGDFGRAEKATVFLIHWPDWSGDLPAILASKRDQTALVIYAPQGQGCAP